MPVTILQGDCLDVLRTLPDQSVHCCVTSPPYYGLRDYGTAQWEGGSAECDHRQQLGGEGQSSAKHNTSNGTQSHQFRGVCGKCGATRKDRQIGLEPTPEAYVAKMVEVFKEVRRVLRNDGTCWINLGDSYSRAPEKGGSGPGNKGNDGNGLDDARRIRSESKGSSDGLVGRGDRAAKRNGAGNLKPKDLVGIPWMVAFALRADGWYLRSDIIWAKPNPMPESVTDRPTKAHEYIFLLSKSERYWYDCDAIREKQNGWNGSQFDDERDLQVRPNTGRKPRQSSEALRGGQMRRSDMEGFGLTRGTSNQSCEHPNGRNKRSVWSVPSAPYSEAHFATFPPDLIKPCILAGCPVGGTVLDCFGGSGTTGMVALELGRNTILIELNPAYCKLSDQRTNVTPGLALC